MANKSKDEGYVQVRLSMPAEYRRLFKSLCAELDVSMSDRITELIRTDLENAGKLEGGKKGK